MSIQIRSIGDLVGDRYEVVGFIGEGGMQQVFEARDLLLDRPVALRAPKNLSASKRFKRSAVVSARVNHANVAKTLDYFEDSEGAYLIEELIIGKDLAWVLKALIVLDPLTIARLFHRLAKGLAASHHVDVVHRDLKPSNIMAVGGEIVAEVKITDFGIAKMAEEELAEAVENDESLTASQTAIGALPYMAPEMIQSIREAGKPTDIWSLGAMMFELLTGKKPFGSGLKAVPNILEAKLQTTAPTSRFKTQFRPAAEEIVAIIKDCLKKDPGARLTADELVECCEVLCYPITPLELGTIKVFDNRYWGFVTADAGSDVFVHIDSIPISHRANAGERVAFARHKGGGNDRGFPVLPLVSR